jgi:hypothetical protein
MDPQAALDALIRESRQYGIPPEAMRAIALVLLRFSASLPAKTYWIPCDAEGQWLLTTLEQTGGAAVQKQVMLAYATAEAAQRATGQSEGLETLSLLLQLIALEPLDSLVLYENADSLKGVEIQRDALLRAISATLGATPDSGFC